MILRRFALAVAGILVLPHLAGAGPKTGEIIVTAEEIRALEEPRRYSWETAPGQIGTARAPVATAAAASVRETRSPHTRTARVQTQPRRVAKDPRVRTVRFVENDVVRVDTDLRFITAVEFAQGESVTAVLAGDSESFEIVRLKSGNVLSIKPLVRRARTNINVYTDRRTYVLDVREGRRRGLTHRVRFDYPAPPPGPAEIAAAATAALPRNRDYSAAGDADFRPVEAWDDGTSTYFRFARNARRPAVFWSDATGADFATNTAQLDDLTVRVGLIRDRWTLRLGRDVVCIVRGPAPEALRAAVAEANRARRTESQ